MKAVDEKKMRYGKKKPSFIARLNSLYCRADSIVSVKFLCGLCVGLVSLLVRNSFTASSSSETAVEWFYIQGVGKVLFHNFYFDFAAIHIICF
jgi:hypothetical protein